MFSNSDRIFFETVIGLNSVFLSTEISIHSSELKNEKLSLSSNEDFISAISLSRIIPFSVWIGVSYISSIVLYSPDVLKYIHS